jgi:hypothetical protein
MFVRKFSLNPPDQTRFISPGQLMFPDPQHPPAGRPQSPRHQKIPRPVAGKFILPKRAVAFRLRCMPRTAVPETAVHKQSQPRPPENKIRTNRKSAECGVRSAEWNRRRPKCRNIPHSAFRNPHCHPPLPAIPHSALRNPHWNLPPPAGDFVSAKPSGQRNLRGLVPARTDARHHLRPLLFGKHISHFYFNHRFIDRKERPPSAVLPQKTGRGRTKFLPLLPDS